MFNSLNRIPRSNLLNVGTESEGDLARMTRQLQV